MKLKPEDMNIYKQLALQQFLSIGQGARIEGMTTPMTHGDRLAVAFLEASVRLLVKLKVTPDQMIDLVVPMEQPDSDPAAEDHTWMEEPEPT